MVKTLVFCVVAYGLAVSPARAVFCVPIDFVDPLIGTEGAGTQGRGIKKIKNKKKRA